MRLAGSTSLRVLFWAAALFALVMASLPHPIDLPGHPDDKVQHAIAFFTLGVLGGSAYPRVPLLRLLLLLSLFGVLIELIQAIPALNRDSDLADWAADTIAAAAALLVIRQFRRRQ